MVYAGQRDNHMVAEGVEENAEDVRFGDKVAEVDFDRVDRSGEVDAGEESMRGGHHHVVVAHGNPLDRVLQLEFLACLDEHLRFVRAPARLSVQSTRRKHFTGLRRIPSHEQLFWNSQITI